MKSKYDKNSNTLKEQPEMGKTINPTLKEPRTIPCSANNWKDGQELEEGKDYYIGYSSKIKGKGVFAAPIVAQETELKTFPPNSPCPLCGSTDVVNAITSLFCKKCGGWVSFKSNKPPAQETEDELWNEVGAMFNGSASFTAYQGFLDKLKSKFIIQRRKQ